MNIDFIGLFCGVGGIRTLVQTSNYRAFYTLSFCLGFRELAGQKLPTHSLALINLENTSKHCVILIYFYDTQKPNDVN